MESYLGDSCRELVSLWKTRPQEPAKDFTSETVENYMALRSLIKYLLDILDRVDIGNSKNSMVFRWLLSQKLAVDEEYLDPIIPSSRTKNIGLRLYLKSQLFKPSKIEQIEHEFCNKTQSVLHNKKIPIGLLPLTSSKQIKLLKFENHYSCLVTCIGEEFRISHSRYETLRQRYIGPPEDFNLRLAMLLMRYDPMNTLCSGYSGGCTKHLFRVLEQKIGVNWELFASPLNCNLDNYLSAHDDTDRWFGSQGNFFAKFNDLVSVGGSFEVNPPFTEEYLTLVTSKILEAFDNNPLVPLTFVYIHPFWPDLYSYKDVQKSRYLVKLLNLDAKEHYYESGLGYDTDNRNLVRSSAPSTIFLLQNDPGRQSNPITLETIEAIRSAFKTN